MVPVTTIELITNTKEDKVFSKLLTLVPNSRINPSCLPLATFLAIKGKPIAMVGFFLAPCETVRWRNSARRGLLASCRIQFGKITIEIRYRFNSF